MDVAAFEQYLIDIGLAPPARQLFANVAGATDINSFMEINSADFDDVWEAMAKTASAMRPANEAQRPVLPFPSKVRLKAFRYYCDYREASSFAYAREEAIVSFEDEVFEWWAQHIRSLKDYDKDSSAFTEVPDIQTLKSWMSWKELVKTRLGQMRSLPLGIPMSYLIRPNDESTTDDLNADYPTALDMLYATVDIEKVPNHLDDNQAFYDFLKSKTVKGDLWSFVKAFESNRDGRGAWLALVAQAEGPAQKANRIDEAYADLNNLHFNGKARNFTFDKYVQRHQQCHNILSEADNDEQITEHRKIELFLNGIKAEKLATSVAVVRSQAHTPAYSTFQLVQTYLTGQWNVINKAKRGDPNESFKVAGLEQDGKKQAKKQAPSQAAQQQQQKKKRKQQGTGFIPHAQWKKLLKDDPEKAAAIMKKRKEEQAKKKAKVSSTSHEKKNEPAKEDSSITSAISKAVSFGVTEGKISHGGKTISFQVGAVDSVDSKPSVVVTKPAKGTKEELEQAKAKSASSQFGRQARKKAQTEHTLKNPPSLDDKIEKKDNKKDKTDSSVAASSITTSLVSEPDPMDISAVTIDRPVQDSDSLWPSGPSQTSYEDEMVWISRATAIKLGVNVAACYNSDEEMDDDVETDDHQVEVLVSRKELIALHPKNYAMSEYSNLTPKPNEARRIREKLGSDKWCQDIAVQIGGNIQLRKWCSQYKGNNVHELKDPLQVIRVQATRYAELKAEKDFNGSFETKEDEQEYHRLIVKRGTLLTNASHSGKPEDSALYQAWNEAECGSISMPELQKAYNNALQEVASTLEEYKVDPDTVIADQDANESSDSEAEFEDNE